MSNWYFSVAYLHMYVCMSLCFLVFVCSTTHFAFACLLRCVYDFFSFLPLLLRFKSYQQQRKCYTHQYKRKYIHTYACMCSLYV